MLKKFFIVIMGSLTAIWISAGLMFFFFFMFIGVIAAMGDKDAQVEVKKHSVLHVKLEGELVERPVPNDIWSELYGMGNTSVALSEINGAIRTAANDDKIDCMFLELPGSEGGIAMRSDIVDAIRVFKQSGKKIIAYADSYSQGDYYIASLADEVFVNPVGAVDIHGLSSQNLFFKGAMDKLGVKMQIVKVGTYKSAVEPFILTEMSEANREQTSLYLNNIWSNMTGTIAEARGTDSETVNQWADSLIMCAAPTFYVDSRIVNSLAYRNEVIDELKTLTEKDKDEKLNLITPAQYCASVTLEHQKSEKNKIAVLYAVGEISDTGNEGIVGPTMVREIEKLIDDDDNAGLVLRVNSPGGSAFASEQIWEALQRYKKTERPLYVSMSDYAASGGYYISCGADKIYAQPTTITGSIGIFGMIPCVEGLMTNHLGVTTSTVQTNPNATLSLLTPLNTQQMAKLQQHVSRGYETFVGRCAAGRGKTVDEIKAIAEGRVWDGSEALKLGLVDELGNLDDAVQAMADELGFEKYEVIAYPKLKLSFWEQMEELQEEGVIRAMVPGSMSEEYRMYQQVKSLTEKPVVQARMDYVIVR
ncbi:MAG: signal peptide peptidase SppA [Muribaculaceae bacterium]|nr:signal peptide peptidase SppA [Muribaculaceae bacterium]